MPGHYIVAPDKWTKIRAYVSTAPVETGLIRSWRREQLLLSADRQPASLTDALLVLVEVRAGYSHRFRLSRCLCISLFLSLWPCLCLSRCWSAFEVSAIRSSPNSHRFATCEKREVFLQAFCIQKHTRIDRILKNTKDLSCRKCTNKAYTKVYKNCMLRYSENSV